MNPAVKEVWLKDLREGEHSQGQMFLKRQRSGNVTEYCCLGRLTELYISSPENTEKLAWENSETRGIFKTVEDASLPAPQVVKWADMACKTGGTIVISEELRKKYGLISLFSSLPQLNDAGVTFAEIADIIEQQF
jgi:hypothetical protein